MSDVLELTAQIVAAHAANNPVEPDQLPNLIKSVFDALNTSGQPPATVKPKEPAVPIKKSVFSDQLICLECGDSFRMLKRHLKTDHGLTIDEYRQRFSLPHDYPMVAPEYAEMRSALAKEIGLGLQASAKRRRKRA